MRYVEFATAIREELRRNKQGLTWSALQKRLVLPYERPCATWVKRLEADIGLSRQRASGAALIWKIPVRGGDQ